MPSLTFNSFPVASSRCNRVEDACAVRSFNSFPVASREGNNLRDCEVQRLSILSQLLRHRGNPHQPAALGARPFNSFPVASPMTPRRRSKGRYAAMLSFNSFPVASGTTPPQRLLRRAAPSSPFNSFPVASRMSMSCARKASALVLSILSQLLHHRWRGQGHGQKGGTTACLSILSQLLRAAEEAGAGAHAGGDAGRAALSILSQLLPEVSDYAFTSFPWLFQFFPSCFVLGPLGACESYFANFQFFPSCLGGWLEKTDKPPGAPFQFFPSCLPCPSCEALPSPSVTTPFNSFPVASS